MPNFGLEDKPPKLSRDPPETVEGYLINVAEDMKQDFFREAAEPAVLYVMDLRCD